MDKSNVLLVATATIIIIFAIAITAVFQAQSADSASSQGLKVITVGPVWNTNAWSCTSDSDFMIYGNLRSVGTPQLTISVSTSGTQGLWNLEEGKLEIFSIGGPANSNVVITRTGTITGFITLETSSGAVASCSEI